MSVWSYRCLSRVTLENKVRHLHLYMELCRIWQQQKLAYTHVFKPNSNTINCIAITNMTLLKWWTVLRRMANKILDGECLIRLGYFMKALYLPEHLTRLWKVVWDAGHFSNVKLIM